MPVGRSIYIFALLCLLSFVAAAQVNDTQEKKLIQFSGIVVMGDSLDPVPFVNVMIKDSKMGVISDRNGFFSFVAAQNDVIVFSALGFRPATFKIPDTLKSSRYSWIQVMSTDTIFFSEAVIVPWPSQEVFRKTFTETEIPNNDLKRAEKNLDMAEMKERYESIPMDGRLAFQNYVDKQVARSYYKGQYMPNNLLNPFAWAQFIKAWKEGKFKNKKSSSQ
jgi:hypothetical protein